MTKAWSILPEEWKPILKDRGLRPFRADQILQSLYLMRNHVQTMLRRSRGKDANAACGQLRLRHLNG